MKKKKLIKPHSPNISEDFLIANFEKKIQDNYLLKAVFEKIDVYLKSAQKEANGYLTGMVAIEQRNGSLGYEMPYLVPPIGNMIINSVVVASLNESYRSNVPLTDCYELRVENEDRTKHWRKLMFVTKFYRQVSSRREKLIDTFVLTYGLVKTPEMLSNHEVNGNTITNDLAQDSKALHDLFEKHGYDYRYESDWVK